LDRFAALRHRKFSALMKQAGEDPLDATSSPEVPQPSNARGCAFGCLYVIVSWIAVGIIASLLIPAIFYGPQWDHRAIGALVSKAVFVFVSLPLGVYGFIRHRRRGR
jgi:hypothetical protein